MKRKMILLLAALFLLQGCVGVAPETSEKKGASTSSGAGNVNVYVSANGDLLYIDATLSEGAFGTTGKPESFEIRKKRDLISEIIEDENGRVYCSITTSNGVDFGEKVYVVKENNIEEVVNVGKQFGASTLLKSADDIYVQGAVVPADSSSPGVPFVKVDTGDLSSEHAFDVKGVVTADETYKNDIYMFVNDAEKVGYEGFNECYLAKYDYENKKLEIINDDVKAVNPRSMAISEDGKIYVVDTPMFTDEEKSSYLYEYDTNGEFIGVCELDNWADRIILADDDTAYISHRGMNELYDDAGTTVSVFDLKSKMCTKKIDVGQGPSDLRLLDDTLFVATYTDGTVEAYDTKSYKCMGKIKLDDIYRIDQIIVTKH